ncbi:MAG: acyl-CoA dehydrogenase family protein [Candidatus Omnitrophota bacterium]|nr:acyl-CoA dehydrogenase family protein [Candidatus Omnitrophota bacterium]
MELFDKRMGKDKKESLEFAESCRQEEWQAFSFVAGLFRGVTHWNLIHPYPEQPAKDKEEGDKFLKNLEDFLKANLDPDDVDQTREIPPHVVKGLAGMGAFAIKVPKEYDGLGLSQVNYNRVVHLLGSYCGSTAALISAHQSIGVPQPLIICGTEEQKKKYLPRFRQGAISGFALTESEAGSDPRLIKTTAAPVEDGKYYLLNGEKLWCTNGNIANLLVVMAVTPPKIVNGKEKKQISAFIVETNTPGFEVTYRCKFMGLNAIQNGIIKFNNVKVPRENMILGEGEGLKLAFLTLNTGRLTLPAAVIGMSKWCLYVARKWSAERKQWGCPIGEHEAVASKLSYIATTVFAMDAVSRLVSHMADNKKFDIRLEAAMVKLFCTDESWKIVDNTLQIRAGRGYETGPSLKGRGTAAYPVERAMRDSRVNTILEGSSEIMHLFIAREALDFHLTKIKCMLNPKLSVMGKLGALIKIGFDYALWYPVLWIPRLGAGVNFPKPLGSHAKFVSKTARRLARDIFHKMMVNQQKLVQKQNVLNRFVDIGTDLLAISCACSYAASLYKKDEEKNSLKLADLFCRSARRRIAARFKDISCNDDKPSNSLSKSLMAGDYEWLESDIIKKGS